MIAGVLSLLALVAAPAQDEGVTARFRCEPRRVEVGEPFTLLLDLEHPRGTSVFELGTDELALDGSWVVLDHARQAPVADPETGRMTTRRSWRLASLEPGQRSLSEVVSALVLDERVESVDAAETNVEVVGVLGPDEDAPRPLRGFPPGFGQEPESILSPWRWAALVAALLFWSGVLFLVWRRLRARRAPRDVGVDPLARLESLRAGSQDSALASPVAARALHYELTSLLRHATDEHLGVARDGLTDEEWLAVIQASGRISAEVAQEMSRVFERAEAVKYAGSAPSTWAIGETFDQARRSLAGVSPAREGQA